MRLNRRVLAGQFVRSAIVAPRLAALESVEFSDAAAHIRRQAEVGICDTLLWLSVGTELFYFEYRDTENDYAALLRGLPDDFAAMVDAIGASMFGPVIDWLAILRNGTLMGRPWVSTDVSDEARMRKAVHFQAAMLLASSQEGSEEGVRSELAARVMFGDLQSDVSTSDVTRDFVGIVSYMRAVFEILEGVAEDESRLDPAEQSDLSNDLALLLAWSFNLDEPARKERFMVVAEIALGEMSSDLGLDDGQVAEMRKELLALLSRWDQTIAAGASRAPQPAGVA